ncbi:MAG: TIM barrel protein [Eubacteriales bacterium]
MNNRALFGPAGNSVSFNNDGHKHTFEAPAWIAERGLDAYEYSAGNGVNGSLETFAKIGAQAKKYGIAMSLHAPYYISLSSVLPETRMKSIVYIKQSIDAAEAMGADIIIVHTGSTAKLTREEAVRLTKDTLFKTIDELSPFNVRIGLETMGKQNQLGTLDEVIDICKMDPCLYPVVDFGHMNARNRGGLFITADDYRFVFDMIGSELGTEYARQLHCHFSKVEFTNAGEKKHLTFGDSVYGPEFEPLIETIVKESLYPRIICESDGTMAEDAKTMKNIYETLLKL